MDGVAIFEQIVKNMESDHGVNFVPTPQEIRGGAMLCENLRDAGYFMDDPADVDGDFWRAATGDYQRAMAHFKNSPAYRELNSILETLFERAS